MPNAKLYTTLRYPEIHEFVVGNSMTDAAKKILGEGKKPDPDGPEKVIRTEPYFVVLDVEDIDSRKKKLTVGVTDIKDICYQNYKGIGGGWNQIISTENQEIMWVPAPDNVGSIEVRKSLWKNRYTVKINYQKISFKAWETKKVSFGSYEGSFKVDTLKTGSKLPAELCSLF
jgi:hypothetical protein